MSHIYGHYGPSKAVDGNTNNIMFDNSCSHTSSYVGWQWWQVDLEKVYSVTSVVISNRGDCCSYRLNNFTVELSVQDPSTLKGFPALTIDSSVCFHQAEAFPSYPPKRFQCRSPTIGRFLRLVKYDQFAVCEVEVYGDLVVTTTTPATTTRKISQAIKRGKWKCVQQNQCSQSLTGANISKNIFSCASRLLSEKPVGEAPFMQISISSGECRMLASLKSTNTSSDWVTYKYV